MSNELTTIEQKQVLFYDDKITAVRLKDGRVFVPVKPICERLGVQWAAQSKRIRRDPVLSKEIMSMSITDTDIRESGSRRPRTSEMLCLPLDFISGFLFGINATRVKEELRDRVIRYQRECYKVLAEAFQEGRLTTDTRFEELLDQDTETVQAYKMAMAIVKLAKQQILLDGRVGDAEVRLENVEERLTTMEEQLSGQDVVTESQASQISQAVKTVAIALGKQTGRNEFGACYGEIYRRFNTTSYRLLPKKKFDEVMAFLTEWHQSLVGDSPF